MEHETCPECVAGSYFNDIRACRVYDPIGDETLQIRWIYGETCYLIIVKRWLRGGRDSRVIVKWLALH